MAQNTTGQQVDYETFKAEFDSSPALQAVVKRFDDRGVVVNTREKDMPTVGQEKTGKVDAMAKRAAAKLTKR